MKLAIVGLGTIATSQIRAALSLAADIQLVAGCDTNPVAERALPGGVPFFSSLVEMIRSSRPAIVLISTPNKQHYDTALEALEEQQPLLIEKPLCESREQLATLVQRGREQRTFLHVAFHAAFAKDLLWWLERKEVFHTQFGELVRIHMQFFDPYVLEEGSIALGRHGLGGSWFDSGINALSVLGRIAEPAKIHIESAYMAPHPSGLCEQISASVQLTFPTQKGTCRVTIETDWTKNLNQKITTLFYERAVVILNHSLQEVTIQDATSREVISHQAVGGEVERLTNHYIGVFSNLKQSFELGRDNIAHAKKLHELLFSAIDIANRTQRSRDR